MSFTEMKVADLRQLCAQLGVEVDQKASKTEMLVELEENGVTWDYVKTLQDNFENNKPDDDDLEESNVSDKSDASKNYIKGDQLLKMVGTNSSFEVLGFKFTKKNPFNIMSVYDAQKIIDFYPDKFRLAHPKEAQEFYA